jgi:hypothetical protein
MMDFQTAMTEAKRVSEETGCVQHVNAIIGEAGYPAESEPRILGYMVSDWYAIGQTVAIFHNGERV